MCKQYKEYVITSLHSLPAFPLLHRGSTTLSGLQEQTKSSQILQPFSWPRRRPDLPYALLMVVDQSHKSSPCWQSPSSWCLGVFSSEPASGRMLHLPCLTQSSYLSVTSNTMFPILPQFQKTPHHSLGNSIQEQLLVLWRAHALTQEAWWLSHLVVHAGGFVLF